MKKLLAVLLNLTLFTPLASASECQHPFVDVIDHWAEEEICRLYGQGIIDGYSERNFLPNQEITRAEFIKMALLNLGYTVYAVQSAGFSDVASGEWYYQYITFAKSKGFINGYGDGTFKPNEPINRAEAVVIIMQMAGITDYDSFGSSHRFSDVSSDDWFAAAVDAATDQGIIEGYGDGSFRPDSNLSRAEAAVIAVRVWQKLY